jgi:hypothetical protein
MFVISNGAVKSGSTWLANIVVRLVDHRPLPEGYTDLNFGEGLPVIKGNLLRQFLDEVDYHTENYVTSNHFYHERDLLASYRDVYVLNITRDLPDTLLSLLFHTRTRLQEYGKSVDHLQDMKAAYWHYGPESVKRITRYHAIWNRPCAWVYVSSYERLKADPMTEIAAIAAFLKLTPSESTIARIVEETSLEKLSASASALNPDLKARFRHGVVGESEKYVDAGILADIRRIEAENRQYPSNEAELLEYRSGGW